jgi:hypothetical protein
MVENAMARVFVDVREGKDANKMVALRSDGGSG